MLITISLLEFDFTATCFAAIEDLVERLVQDLSGSATLLIQFLLVSLLAIGYRRDAIGRELETTPTASSDRAHQGAPVLFAGMKYDTIVGAHIPQQFTG
jgi:hypothetical protein